MLRTRLLLLVSLVAAAPAAAQQVASIQLSHKAIALTPGARQTVFATAYTSAGSPVSTPFRWSSTDRGVATVEVAEDESDFADIVGVGPGSARIEVRAGSRVETIDVTVTGGAGGGSGTAAVLNIDPPNIQLLRGETQTLTPVFLRADGEPAASAPVTWTSLSPSVASVDASRGVVVGISAGQGAIQAGAGGLTKVATVEVADAPFAFTVPVLGLSPGAEDTIHVVVPSQRSRPLGSGGLTWRSTNEQIVRVTPLGIAQGVGAGRASIAVEGYGQVRELPVTVHRAVAEAVAVPPTDRGAIQVPLNGSRSFKLTSLAADGTEVPEAPVAWVVADTTVATFDMTTRALTGRTIGQTTLTGKAAAPGLNFVWQIDVIAGGVLVAPGRVGMNVGDTVSLAASFTTTDGTPLGPASGVQWTTENANVVAVDGEGHLRGVDDGHARVIGATAWGSADTAEVFVSGPLLFTTTRTGSADLFTLDPNAPTRAAHQVTSAPSNEAMGAWSPDGSRIAFVSDRDGNYELYVADASGENPRRLTTSPDLAELTPVWTLDGLRIVYAVQGASGRTQIRSINVDGSDGRVLTTDTQGANLDPAISPDGRLIAFTSTRDGNYEVYLMDLDGSNQRAALVSPLKETKPAWFPNGDLAVLQERTDRGQITSTVARVPTGGGGTPQPLTPPELPVTDFAVSGAGDVLVLEVTVATVDGRSDRHLMVLRIGTAAVDLARDGDEQLSGPALRPLTRR
jgi:uncharacterized protein YjdB